MPVAVACPKCQKKYTLPDNMLGRPVKCSACSAQFKTPARQAADHSQRKTDTRQLAAQQKARAEAQLRAKELQRMGVEGVIQRSPDVFEGLTPMQGTSDPLANHRIEDPGFGEVKYKSDESADENEPADPMAGMFENPAIDKTKKSRPKKKQDSKTKTWYMSLWIWLIALALIGIVVAVLFIFVL